MVEHCSLANVKNDLRDMLCTKEGWKQIAKYTLVALAAIAVVGLALALTLKFSSAAAASGVGQSLTALASNKFVTYLIAGSATLLGVLAVGRAANSFGLCSPANIGKNA